MRVESAPPGCLSQCVVADLGDNESLQRNETSRPGDGRDHEPVQVVDDRSRDEFGKRAVLTLVRVVQGIEVLHAVTLVHNCRRKTESDQNEVQE